MWRGLVMNELLSIAVIIVIGIAGFFAVRLTAFFISVLRLPYWPTKITLVAEAIRAPDQQAAVDELEQLGFTQVALFRSETGPHHLDGILFEYAGREAFARLTFTGGVNSAYIVEFYSFIADSGILLTVNRTGWIEAVSNPNAAVADALANSLAEHWERHQARMRGATLVCLEASEANQLTAAFAENALPFLIEKRAVVKGRDGAWHPTIRSAWRISRAWFKVRSRLAQPYHSPCTTGPHRSTFFARYYEQIEAISAARPPRLDVKATVLIVTLAAFLALWGNLFDWEFAAILAFVLLVHEAGHAIAMRAFGYRDIMMFFIPFFGAAVAGTAKDMPAWKQIIVLLAGPMPGLLAAAGFLLYSEHYPFETGSLDFNKIAVIALAVNLSNLLPVTPLDGGKLLEVSVFSRWPQCRLALAVLSVVAFSALGIWMQDPLFLPIVASLLFPFAPSWRLTVLQRAWKEGLSSHDQLRHLFEVARQSFGTQTFARAYATCQSRLHPTKNPSGAGMGKRIRPIIYAHHLGGSRGSNYRAVASKAVGGGSYRWSTKQTAFDKAFYTNPFHHTAGLNSFIW